jgi:hypothetical protein
LGRYILHQVFGVETGASFIQQRFVKVGGENLERGRARGAIGKFHVRHRQRIGLLARGTAHHPHAQRSLAAPRDEPGKNFALQNSERFRVAKKTGHADERV